MPEKPNCIGDNHALVLWLHLRQDSLQLRLVFVSCHVLFQEGYFYAIVSANSVTVHRYFAT